MFGTIRVSPFETEDFLITGYICGTRKNKCKVSLLHIKIVVRTVETIYEGGLGRFIYTSTDVKLLVKIKFCTTRSTPYDPVV